jgi:hypothetical protein
MAASLPAMMQLVVPSACLRACSPSCSSRVCGSCPSWYAWPIKAAVLRLVLCQLWQRVGWSDVVLSASFAEGWFPLCFQYLIASFLGFNVINSSSDSSNINVSLPFIRGHLLIRTAIGLCQLNMLPNGLVCSIGKRHDVADVLVLFASSCVFCVRV